MIFDLRTQVGLPKHLEMDLRKLGKGSKAAVVTYLDFYKIKQEDVTDAHFGVAMGISWERACEHAAAVSELLDCPVHFSFNDRPLTAYPNAARACMATFGTGLE